MKVPLFVKSAPTVKVPEVEVKVPAVIVKLPDKVTVPLMVKVSEPLLKVMLW